MRTLSLQDVKARLLADLVGKGYHGGLRHDLEAVFESIEKEMSDSAPMSSRALWTSLGYHADVTFANEHWTLRTFPGGWSAKCNRTGAFHTGQSDGLQQAMLDAEKFVFEELEVPTSPVLDPTLTKDLGYMQAAETAHDEREEG